MANENAIIPYLDPSALDIANTLGITQFQGETGWHQTIGGLLIQGGKTVTIPTDSTLVVPFFVGFPKQILGVFLQTIYGTASPGNENSGMVTAVGLSQFTLVNDGVAKQFYWWAIGV